MEKDSTVRIVAILKPKRPYYDFAIQELKSLLEMVGIDIYQALKPELSRSEYFENKHPTYLEISPSIIHRKFFVSLDIAKNQLPLLQIVVERSIIIRTFIQIYGQGDTLEDLLSRFDADAYQPEMDSTQSFYFHVTATCRSLKTDEQLRDIQRFDKYPFKGKCAVKNPERTFWLIQSWQFVDKDGSSWLEQVFFGKEVVKTPKGRQ